MHLDGDLDMVRPDRAFQGREWPTSSNRQVAGPVHLGSPDAGSSHQDGHTDRTGPTLCHTSNKIVHVRHELYNRAQKQILEELFIPRFGRICPGCGGRINGSLGRIFNSVVALADCPTVDGEPSGPAILCMPECKENLQTTDCWKKTTKFLVLRLATLCSKHFIESDINCRCYKTGNKSLAHIASVDRQNIPDVSV